MGRDTELNLRLKCLLCGRLVGVTGHYPTGLRPQRSLLQGTWVGEARAAPPRWQGGQVALQLPCAPARKVPPAIHQVAPRKRLRPHVQSSAPVDESPWRAWPATGRPRCRAPTDPGSSKGTLRGRGAAASTGWGGGSAAMRGCAATPAGVRRRNGGLLASLGRAGPREGRQAPGWKAPLPRAL